MYTLEYYWKHSGLWYKYGALFNDIDEAIKRAYPWYIYGPHGFRIKDVDGNIIWENYS